MAFGSFLRINKYVHLFVLSIGSLVIFLLAGVTLFLGIKGLSRIFMMA